MFHHSNGAISYQFPHFKDVQILDFREFLNFSKEGIQLLLIHLKSYCISHTSKVTMAINVLVKQIIAPVLQNRSQNQIMSVKNLSLCLFNRILFFTLYVLFFAGLGILSFCIVFSICLGFHVFHLWVGFFWHLKRRWVATVTTMREIIAIPEESKSRSRWENNAATIPG